MPGRSGRACRPVAFTAMLLLSMGSVSRAHAVAPPPCPVVSAVVVIGNRVISAEAVTFSMKTRAGDRFHSDVIMGDVRRLYSNLQFSNVYADVKPDGAGKIKVVVYIRDYPSLVEKVTCQGCNHLSRNDLEQLTGVRKGMPCNPTANKAACRRIEARLTQDGRWFASCELIKGNRVSDTEVLFAITEGPQLKVRSISFEGNNWASAGQLRTQTRSTPSACNAVTLDRDRQALVNYYRDHGFLDVRVSRELVAEDSQLDVIYHIAEGKRRKSREGLPGEHSPTTKIIVGTERR